MPRLERLDKRKISLNKPLTTFRQQHALKFINSKVYYGLKHMQQGEFISNFKLHVNDIVNEE